MATGTNHSPTTTVDPLKIELELLVAGEHGDPHHILGVHAEGDDTVVRGYRPGAEAMTVVLPDGRRVEMTREHPAGVFCGRIGEQVSELLTTGGYELEVRYPDPSGQGRGATFTVDDPYRFWPTLGELDVHLIGEGRHELMWCNLGAHPRVHEGVAGTAFAVWAPNARGVRVVGDFNSWDGRLHPMRRLGTSGLWELFLPAVKPGDKYKYEIIDANGNLRLKADPFAFATEKPPGTASVVFASEYEWSDAEWLRAREQSDPLHTPFAVYECHLGSWRTVPEEGDRALTYRELAEELPPYLVEHGFTHVEFLPVAEHPFGGSWGYQVSAYYAPTARFGPPDDFRAMVDALHQAGIGVIVDWVPAHFPKDEFALARFDGTALYEHADPRQGEHPDWGTLVFNFGRNEVRNFLVANALFWVAEYHIDGLRVDAVASMLYLDYSRKEGEWIPNKFGGRENLEAVDFLKEFNTTVLGKHPGVVTVAEESTAWPMVSRPTYVGGLGFVFKWNMGWMHDTLDYFHHEPVHRRYHHHELTFGMLYAFTENFVLPLSHDEVVHGKGSLLQKMPGDRWQQLANLRALLAWMWAHPGKKLLFMGAEMAQDREWAHDRSLDWHLLQHPSHAGVDKLLTTLNLLYKERPSLYEQDFEWTGFAWIDANDTDQNVLSFLRYPADRDGGKPLACIANLSPVVREGYRIGVPHGGSWQEVLNTDATDFWGSGVVNGAVNADGYGWHGHDQSLALTLPPLAVVWLEPEG
ncbi:MAG TPA: 1,4-alpha-glucan branching protein GlgB [Acidimicrobiia bacterium]|nr:1,4-alpha-glucan branching protein GlgB [Acidimicrobiia bacterium]